MRFTPTCHHLSELPEDVGEEKPSFFPSPLLYLLPKIRLGGSIELECIFQNGCFAYINGGFDHENSLCLR